jgi:hypothetical protein
MRQGVWSVVVVVVVVVRHENCLTAWMVRGGCSHGGVLQRSAAVQ